MKMTGNISCPSSKATLPALSACIFFLASRSIVPVAADECTGRLSNPSRCHHGSVCHSGPSDYGDLLTPFADSIPFLADTDIDGEHCECSLNMHTGDLETEGHTGVTCEHKYEVCSPKHSGFACFHGSTCVKLKNMSGQHLDHKYACDCSTAKWDGQREQFVGMQCEYGGPRTEMEVCDPLGDMDDNWFCLNGGSCHDSKNIDKKCKCADDFHGPHCEYHITNDDAPNAEDCTLQCQNGGQCKHGLKDYGKHSDQAEKSVDMESDPYGLESMLENLGRHEDLMHCVCPKGFTGLRCDIQVEECKGDGGEDDVFYCYNGSKCAKEYLEDGSKHHYCDCDHANGAEVSYAGKFCQYKSTSFCDPVKGMKEALAFCVNYGVCPVTKHETCHCPPGFVGHQCEERGFEKPPCSLQCQNGGVCRTGTKDYGHVGDKFNLPFQQESHLNFEHCSCPEGWTGVDCSIPMEICGGMQHVCTHGSTCVEKSQGVYECDCSAATIKSKAIAGLYCEHDVKAQDMCTKGNAADSSRDAHSFCVNGGVCVGIVSPNDPHPGCLCEDGFEGPHCEFKTTVLQSRPGMFSGGEPETTEKSRKAAILFTFMIIIIGCIAFVAVLAVRKYGKDDREMDTGANNNGDVFDAGGRPHDSSTMQHVESAEEDGELADVELI